MTCRVSGASRARSIWMFRSVCRRVVRLLVKDLNYSFPNRQFAQPQCTVYNHPDISFTDRSQSFCLCWPSEVRRELCAQPLLDSILFPSRRACLRLGIRKETYQQRKASDSRDSTIYGMLACPIHSCCAIEGIHYLKMYAVQTSVQKSFLKAPTACASFSDTALYRDCGDKHIS
jgi:hypothetical protein